MSPLSGADLFLRVGCHLQWIVIRRPLALLNFLDLLTDRDHCITEPVKLGFVLRFSWLHHQ